MKLLCCFKSSRCLLISVLLLLVAVAGVLRLAGEPLNSLLRRSLATNQAWIAGHDTDVSSITTGALWGDGEEPSSKNDPPRSKGPLRFFSEEVIKSSQEILRSQWMERLRYLLRTVNVAGQVAITFASYNYIQSLLNWLIVAQVKVNPPMMNVIVICLDENVFKLLDERDIPSVHISPDSVIRKSSGLQNKTFSTVWVMRLAIYRLINYIGYDVVSYDTDAIIMRNPQPMFDRHRDSDIVSSAGSFPFRLGKKWGFTMCMGVILFRSSPKTEMLWNSIHGKSLDDQTLLNTALADCQILWSSEGRSIQNDSMDGVCKNGLKATVLPYSKICRTGCARILKEDESTREKLYVWHQLTGKSGKKKLKAASTANIWFLNWTKSDAPHNSSLKGTEWLASLAATGS